MRQTQAKLNWYKKLHENGTGIHQLATLWKTATSALTKENVKTVIGNSSNSSSHGEHAKAMRFCFASIKNNNIIKSCQRVILMARI